MTTVIGNQGATVPLRIVRGVDRAVTLFLLEGGVIYDLTGHTATVSIRKSAKSTTELMSMVPVIDVILGSITLPFSAADTDAAQFSEAIYTLNLSVGGAVARVIDGPLELTYLSDDDNASDTVTVETANALTIQMAALDVRAAGAVADANAATLASTTQTALCVTATNNANTQTGLCLTATSAANTATGSVTAAITASTTQTALCVTATNNANIVAASIVSAASVGAYTQTATDALLALKANLASPTFSGLVLVGTNPLALTSATDSVAVFRESSVTATSSHQRAAIFTTIYSPLTGDSDSIFTGMSARSATVPGSSGNLTGTDVAGSMVGGIFYLEALGTGVVTRATAVAARIECGTFTDAAYFRATAPVVATTVAITTLSGLVVEGGAISGITNRYGVKIDNLIGGTNRWGIYQAGTNDNNFFAGQTTVQNDFEISRDTGSSSPTPATVRIRSTTSASDWGTSPWGVVDFWSDDASGAGAGVRARIGVYSANSTGSTAGLIFYVANTSTIVEAFRVDNTKAATFVSSISAAGISSTTNVASTTGMQVGTALTVGTTSTLTGNVGIGGASSASTALLVPAGTTALSSIRIPHGAAPTSPVNGDVWSTTAGLFIRINGTTKTVTLT